MWNGLISSPSEELKIKHEPEEWNSTSHNEVLDIPPFTVDLSIGDEFLDFEGDVPVGLQEKEFTVEELLLKAEAEEEDLRDLVSTLPTHVIIQRVNNLKRRIEEIKIRLGYRDDRVRSLCCST